ncbi:MAG: hypothetical protein GY853_13555 [PVC group bacterium]|nr:hypothetical protein [PVC group bacterium]
MISNEEHLLLALQEATIKIAELKRILLVIEGLTYPELKMQPKSRIRLIRKFAHCAGDCNNKHDDWRGDLDLVEEVLKKSKII